MSTQVFVVDNEQLVRRGLCEWLSSIDGIEIAGDAEDVDSGYSAIGRVNPQVVLVDLHLPGVSGLELVNRLRGEMPTVACVVLSGNRAPGLVYDAFAAGARGFLPKKVTADELRVAIHQVMSGHWYVPPAMMQDVVSLAMTWRLVGDAVESNGGRVVLSDRERELLKLVAEGNTFTEIAKQLSMNSRSVERLKAKLQEKLGVKGLAGLIRQAIKLGIVRP